MSIWYEIKNIDDVEVSEDGKEIDVLYNNDLQGNYYVSIPIDFARKVLKDFDSKQRLIIDSNE